MAKKVSRSIVRPKRFDYVCDDSQNSSLDFNLDSSEDDGIDEMTKNQKVRQGVSIRDLIKGSENFEKGDDHIYTKLRNKNDRVEKSSNIRTRRTRSTNSGKCNELETDNGKRKRHLTFEEDDDEECDTNPKKKPKCFSKNAVMARLNRERKKKYISSLESDNLKLRNENVEINQKIQKQDKMIELLKNEIVYLKTFLANSKEICQILQNLNQSTGLPVTSSLFTELKQNPSKLSPEHGYVSGSESTVSKESSQAVCKSVTSGSNFPIMTNDVNLGGFSLSDDEDSLMRSLSPEFDDVKSPLFPFEFDQAFNECCENLMNFETKSSDTSFHSTIDSKVDYKTNYESPLSKSETDYKFQNSDLSDVGLCLHVNKKKISVELCSVCNSKASSFKS